MLKNWDYGNILMCSTVQEQISTCGQNAIVKIGERTNIRPQKQCYNVDPYQPVSQKVTDPESTVYNSASKSTI